MTLERILTAAKNSMINGHHAPHCYSAHVKGHGYVSQGLGPIEDRADYLRQLAREVQSEIDNMGYAPDYADKGYTTPRRGILLADWNKFPRNFDKVLEKAGYAIEWSDEWTICDSCNKAVRTSPDSYFWEPEYKDLDDGTTLCTACYADEYPEDTED